MKEKLNSLKMIDRKVAAFMAIAILAFVGFAVLKPGESPVVSESTVVAQEETTEQETADSVSEQEVEKAGYEYVAQPGDSYSKIARKAVQTYGILNEVALSEAQIIYAETVLTQQAGAPNLAIGQQVTINQADVQSVIEAAQALSDDAEALWVRYVASVDFDTDQVGETRG